MIRYGRYGYSYQGPGSRLLHVIGWVVILFMAVSYFSRKSLNLTTGNRQRAAMTAAEEMSLGLQLAPQMIARLGGELPASDPRSREVRNVGQRIISRSLAQHSPYHYEFHLLSDQQTINAFALPGGQILLTLGLYEKLADEAELAAVLGHETGHVVQRHVAQQIEQSRLGQSIVSSGNGNGLATWALTDLAEQVMQLKFTRRDELQADERGLEFMAEAGYDPRAMIDVMTILKEASAVGGEPEFLQTHPDPGNRIEAIETWVKRHPFLAEQLSRGQALPK